MSASSQRLDSAILSPPPQHPNLPAPTPPSNLMSSQSPRRICFSATGSATRPQTSVAIRPLQGRLLALSSPRVRRLPFFACLQAPHFLPPRSNPCPPEPACGKQATRGLCFPRARRPKFPAQAPSFSPIHGFTVARVRRCHPEERLLRRRISIQTKSATRTAHHYPWQYITCMLSCLREPVRPTALPAPSSPKLPCNLHFRKIASQLF